MFHHFMTLNRPNNRKFSALISMFGSAERLLSRLSIVKHVDKPICPLQDLQDQFTVTDTPTTPSHHYNMSIKKTALSILYWRLFVAAFTRRSCWFHMTYRSTDHNVSLVQFGTCRLSQAMLQNTLGILTIRLPRYFSTSHKLRTDTFALGIIIPCLRSR